MTIFFEKNPQFSLLTFSLVLFYKNQGLSLKVMENVEQHLPDLYMRPAEFKRETDAIANANSIAEHVAIKSEPASVSQSDDSDNEEESHPGAKRKNDSRSEDNRRGTKRAHMQRDSSNVNTHTEGNVNSPISEEHRVLSAEQSDSVTQRHDHSAILLGTNSMKSEPSEEANVHTEMETEEHIQSRQTSTYKMFYIFNKMFIGNSTILLYLDQFII